MASVRTDGSLALNMQPVPQRDKRQRVYIPTPQEQRRLEQQRRKEQQLRLEEAILREAQKRALARRETLKKLGIVIYVSLLFAMLSLVVVGYARIAAIKMDNNVLTGEIQGYNSQIADLKLELSQKTDLQYIRQQAEERLNMGYPKAYQILEIELRNGDTATAAGGNGSNQSGANLTANNAD